MSEVSAPNQWEDGYQDDPDLPERLYTGDESDVDCISDDEPFTNTGTT
jgi:hypothetical protein